MTNATKYNSKTAADYTDVRASTTDLVKSQSDYRVFVETNNGETRIVAYKRTFRAADMLTNKIGKEHIPFSVKSWGWEIKDKYNEGQW